MIGAAGAWIEGEIFVIKHCTNRLHNNSTSVSFHDCQILQFSALALSRMLQWTFQCCNQQFSPAIARATFFVGNKESAAKIGLQ
jgi:hypothetical protein